MTIQIRRGVFETNSSSTHSLTICAKEDYDNWKSGKVYLNDGGGWASLSPNAKKQFLTKDEVIDVLTNSKYPPDTNLEEMDDETFEEYLRDQEIYSCDSYFSDDSLETFEQTHTTKSGDEIVAFGKYGS